MFSPASGIGLRMGVDLDAISQFVAAVHYNGLTGGETGCDFHIAALSDSGGDRRTFATPFSTVYTNVPCGPRCMPAAE